MLGFEILRVIFSWSVRRIFNNNKDSNQMTTKAMMTMTPESLPLAKLYDAMERNGFYLPSVGSSRVTKKWLADVRAGCAYCPRYEDVRLRPCPEPPRKSVLAFEVANALQMAGDQRSF